MSCGEQGLEITEALGFVGIGTTENHDGGVFLQGKALGKGGYGIRRLGQGVQKSRLFSDNSCKLIECLQVRSRSKVPEVGEGNSFLLQL